MILGGKRILRLPAEPIMVVLCIKQPLAQPMINQNIVSFKWIPADRLAGIYTTENILGASETENTLTRTVRVHGIILLVLTHIVFIRLLLRISEI